MRVWVVEYNSKTKRGQYQWAPYFDAYSLQFTRAPALTFARELRARHPDYVFRVVAYARVVKSTKGGKA